MGCAARLLAEWSFRHVDLVTCVSGGGTPAAIIGSRMYEKRAFMMLARWVGSHNQVFEHVCGTLRCYGTCGLAPKPRNY